MTGQRTEGDAVAGDTTAWADIEAIASVRGDLASRQSGPCQACLDSLAGSLKEAMSFELRKIRFTFHRSEGMTETSPGLHYLPKQNNSSTSVSALDPSQ